ncbi:hypothetical protein ACFL4T_08365 [candidate division KSB1 bacterium]
MTKTPFVMDERNRLVLFRICTIMYYFTMLALMGVLLYRENVLNQPIREFNDIAIIFTVNVIVLLGAVFYFGGITFSRFKIKTVLSVYAIFVIIGFLFTFIRNRFFVDPPLSMSEIFNKLYIIVIICGLLTLLWTFFAFLGKKKLDKVIKDE